MRRTELTRQTEERRAMVKELSLAGMSVPDIAAQIGVSEPTVEAMRTALADRGEIEPIIKLSPEQEQQALALFRKQVSTREIIAQMGLDRRILKNLKMMLQARAKMELVEELVRAGRSTRQIAKALCISLQGATHLRKRLINKGALPALVVRSGRYPEASRLYNAGKNRQEIAEAMGIDANDVMMLVHIGRTEGIVPELRCWECNKSGHTTWFCKSETKKAFEMALAGSTMKAISEATGLSMDSLAPIFSRARKSGRLPADLFPPSGANNAPGRPRKGEYAGLFSQGKSIEAVAEETGCDVMTVAKRWKRWKQAQAA